MIRLLTTGAVALFVTLAAYSAPKTAHSADPAHFATCTGSASCAACKNCRYCRHCNSGGTCGVCR